MKTADGYVRVSRVAGRNGESFISPDEQRAAIEAWARSTKTTILEWHTDLDQSGGTLERPAFSLALERCRSRVTGGIVAAKLDRLTRSVVGLASLLEDAEERGYNLVALDLALDLHSSNGELVANLIGSVAQWERKRRRDDWAVAQRNAVERGVPNGRAPRGYRKRPDGRLEIDEEAVREGAGRLPPSRRWGDLRLDRAQLWLVALDRAADPREPDVPRCGQERTPCHREGASGDHQRGGVPRRERRPHPVTGSDRRPDPGATPTRTRALPRLRADVEGRSPQARRRDEGL